MGKELNPWILVEEWIKTGAQGQIAMEIIEEWIKAGAQAGAQGQIEMEIIEEWIKAGAQAGEEIIIIKSKHTLRRSIPMP